MYLDYFSNKVDKSEKGKSTYIWFNLWYASCLHLYYTLIHVVQRKRKGRIDTKCLTYYICVYSGVSVSWRDLITFSCWWFQSIVTIHVMNMSINGHELLSAYTYTYKTRDAIYSWVDYALEKEIASLLVVVQSVIHKKTRTISKKVYKNKGKQQFFISFFQMNNAMCNAMCNSMQRKVWIWDCTFSTFCCKSFDLYHCTRRYSL